MTCYVHNVPGRLRLRTPHLKRNADTADEIRKALSTLNGIGAVDINLTTGSILINYNHKIIRHEEVLDLLRRRGYYDATRTETTDEYIHKAASKAGSVIGKAIFGTVVEKALEGSALSLISLLI